MIEKGCLLCLLCALVSPHVFADIAAINSGSLPQETTVLDSLKDATELEPYSHMWIQNWNYPVAKNEAATRLGKDLKFLNSAAKVHPDNTELLLLTGLVARYAYNLDVPDSYDASVGALAAAEKLDKADIRAPWFRATLRCQTTEPANGAQEFLVIEDGHPWEKLPPAFWVDYMECSTVTNMPAHTLRAEDHLEKLNVAASDERSFLAGVSQKRFEPFDSKKDYVQKDVWGSEKTGDDISFTSTSCGLRMHVQGDWSVDRLALAKESCVADFSLGPYKGTGSKMRPSILVMVQQPEKDETLEQYAKRFQTKGSFAPFTPSRCPTSRCIAVKGSKPGAYGKDGDGHALMLIFERDQPAFPGLIFETPMQPAPCKGSTGVTYYRPDRTQQRIPGKLYYLVLLDTAASIEEPATKDFDLFLERLIVE